MIIDNLSANPDGSISLSEAHPEKLLERIIKLEQRVKLLESIQANIDEEKENHSIRVVRASDEWEKPEKIVLKEIEGAFNSDAEH